MPLETSETLRPDATADRRGPSGRAWLADGGAPAVLQRLARGYIGPDVVFPGPNAPEGWVIHIAVERISGSDVAVAHD